ncbi:MAG: hypothetical protein LBU65_01560 [Planctomycetaceae bacterium]|jgi:hypothetical protein|nr:hypothetical protein [Planctomycetaceae bacterium]
MPTLFDETLTGANYDVEIRGTNLFHRVIFGMTVGSLVLGVCSSISFVGWYLLPLPILGTVFGAIALWKIMESPETFGGFYIALAGLISSVVFGMFAAGWLSWYYFNAVPAGYREISFEELAAENNGRKIPDNIINIAMSGQRVFIKGYMYQGRQMQGIESFLLVRSIEHCKFCSTQIKPTDMIDVRMVGGQTVAYRTKAVHVGGVLYVRPRFGPGQSPYYLEADVFR